MNEFYALSGTTIEKKLTCIANKQKKHSFTLVPEEVYDELKRLPSFNCEVEMDKCPDDESRSYMDAYFIEGGQCFCVRTIGCRYPNPKTGSEWRFIVDIWKDNQRLSSSFITFGNFLEHLNKDNPS